jgi:hypothetical protein
MPASRAVAIRNLESVLRGGQPPVATIRGAQGVPGPTVTRADAHQSHTDLYALDAKTLYTSTLARFICRGSETPVGDSYECRVRRATAREKRRREDKSAQMYSSIRAKMLSRTKVSCPLLQKCSESGFRDRSPSGSLVESSSVEFWRYLDLAR